MVSILDRVSDSINQLKEQIAGNQEQQDKLCQENISLTEKLGKSFEIVKSHEDALDNYQKREEVNNIFVVRFHLSYRNFFCRLSTN